MRFNYDGISLWYGTDDTPAPGDTVQEGKPIEIVIGVQRPDASNELYRVFLFYRINSGPIQKPIEARILRRDPSGKKRYFLARFPSNIISGLHEGDLVQYTIIPARAGRAILFPNDVNQLASSIRIIRNEEAKGKPIRMLNVKEAIIDSSRAHNIGARTYKAINNNKFHPDNHLKVTAREGVVNEATIATTTANTMNETVAKRTLEYAKLAKLDDDTAKNLIDKNLNLDNLNEITLDSLVNEGLINDNQKKDLQLVAALGKLTGDNLSFIKTLKTDKLKSIADLVKWEKADWKKAIIDREIPVPAGETAETYADKIFFNIEKAYPSHFLLSRLVDDDNGQAVSKATALVNSVSGLSGDNDKLIDGRNPAASIDWNSIEDPAAREKMQKDLQDLVGFTNTYRHLGIADLINNKALSVDEKKSNISARLNLLNVFYKNNPALDLRIAHFFDNTDAGNNNNNNNINWSEIPTADQPAVRKQFMAYQRTENLAEDSADARALLSKGYDSAVAIAEKTEDEFVRESGLSLGKARLTYARAKESSMWVAHSFEAVREVAAGEFANIAMSNVDPRLVNDLRKIDGFDALFGSQNYCDCQECMSILSPAAYFVDLMRFIDDKISKSAFSKQPNHPLYLRNRRNDLWQLELTCENTHNLIPYLTIVNEVLEKYLGRAISSVDDIFKKLSQPLEKISFSLPFNLPLEELKLYVSHFGISLYEIYKLLKQPEEKIWRSKIGLSKQEFDVITTPDTAQIELRYGSPPSFEDFDVQEFIRLVGIDRQQLEELRALSFNPDINSIVIDLKADQDELQNFQEILKNLNLDRLDFIHRFIRLWKRTPWSIEGLDLVMTSLKDGGMAIPTSNNNLNSGIVLYVAQLIDIQEKLKLKEIDELCSMVHYMPTSKDYLQPQAGQADERKTKRLFERLFDLKKLFGENPTTHELNTSTTFHHFYFNRNNTNDKSVNPKTPLLLGGLGISETELLALFDLLKNEIHFDDSGNCILDLKGISLLYRHARLANALKLSVEDFIMALHLNFPANYVVKTIDQIHRLIEFREWLKVSSSFNVSELGLILKGQESSTVKFRLNIDMIAAMVAGIQKSQQAPNRVLKGLDTVAKMVQDIQKEIQESGETDKLKILRDHLCKLFNLTSKQLTDILKFVNIDINSDSGIRSALNTTFTPDGRPKDTGDLDTLLDLMTEMELVLLLFSSLSKFFNLALEQLTDILKWITINNAAIHAALSTSFSPDGTLSNPADLNPLLYLIHDIERILLMFANLKFKEETITYLTTKPALIGIADLKHLTLDNIKALAAYQKFIALDEGAENRPSIRTVLEGYRANNNNYSFSGKEIGTLADIWKKDRNLIESLTSSLRLPNNSIDALERLLRCLDMCQTLGINGFSLHKLVDDDNDIDYIKLESARDIALGAFSSKYSDERTRQEKLEPYLEKINVKKRDALCDYIIALNKELKFKNISDIYAFFLLDPEMGSCARISRLVSAISSLQLYVHRCSVNLEQSQSNPDLNPNIPNIHVDPGLIPVKQWEWMKNYRVWEANRKVFLHTELYLEPDLRDNKSPLFRELEEELLQQKVTKESAEAAYRKYVSQFAELARIRIAGIYYYDKSKTYYIFGHTSKEPVQYYYREWIDNNVWTAWKKIELAINSDRVTAVMHLGKLYLFWSERKFIPKPRLSGGNAVESYTLKKELLYSFLNEQGKWIPPQRLDFVSRDFLPNDYYKFNNFVFPVVKNNEICVFGYDWYPEADGDGGIKKEPAGHGFKIDLFRNKTIPRMFNDNGLMLVPPYSNLFAVDYESKYFLISCQSTQKIHEVELEARDHKWPSMLYGNPAASKTDSRDFSLHLVGYKLGDYWLRLGDQQYLIQNVIDSFTREVENADYPISVPDVKSALYPGNAISASTGIMSWPASDIIYITKRYMYRLSTSLPDRLGEILFTEGLERFLSLETQKEREQPIDVSFAWPAELWGPYEEHDHIDFQGAYGEYYRELFFHIPFLIANHLNANQKFREAKWWYERIFDPTSRESIIEKRSGKMDPDRNWRYIEFRGLTIQKLKQILTDQGAIQLYKNDPFNPHAIARLRLSAYQKAIVMKYIDNLLDWGDNLFAQDTMESINEAAMVYVLASDILGKRPVKLGKCKTADQEGGPLTYSIIELLANKDPEILLTLENWTYGNVITSALAKNNSEEGASDFKVKHDVEDYANIVKMKDSYNKAIKNWENVKWVDDADGSLGTSTARQSTLVFCVPPNTELFKYWDRVEDRLFKIRNCMNISGVRRQLALFAPPINPMLLVRARAAGLSLEDVLSMISTPLPPYRFSYLIEKAKQFTQTVQSFGSALLSALEKKDVEELTLLRSVHERNILRMTKENKKQQIKEAEHQYNGLLETKINVQNRVNYYEKLIGTGLIPWETTQQISRHASSVLQIGDGLLRLYAAISYLIPQIGSPFAMKYGGKEFGDSASAFAELVASAVKIAEAVSASAGLEASFQRRKEEWGQQLLLAQQELKQMDQQILAAEVRKLITEKDLEIHEKNIEQTEELHEFYKNKFTNLGLYNYLSTTLNRLYRVAYNVAYDMAKMAERAYQFERDDNGAIFITGDNWQFDRAGLLAGERLLLQLEGMEKAYIESDRRDYEITQSFSLALLNPSALLTLRQTGSCDFSIPEIMFDLIYPGQYKRLIKSVRISIPSVVGPYSNIGAKLTLIESKVRTEAATDPAVLVDVPSHKLTSIATSNAQNDSGMFELNFQDPRYLKFERAGAVSSWKLELPSKLRSFNYDTISDVIVQISYTAKDDGVFRTKVEDQFAETLSNFAADPNKGLYRLISLKHEFPSAFYRLLHPDSEIATTSQTTEFDLERAHFPYFLTDNQLNMSLVKVYLKPKGRDPINTTGLNLEINDSSVSGWSDFKGSKMKEGTIPSLSGNPIRKWTVDIGSNGFGYEELDDFLILFKYTAASP